MTNDVFCIGLTRTELQTLRVLLPTTFPILTTEPDALDEAMIEHIAEQARCVVLNPKRLTAAQLEEFLYAQRRLLENKRPVPILLFSANMIRRRASFSIPCGTATAQNPAVPFPIFWR